MSTEPFTKKGPWDKWQKAGPEEQSVNPCPKSVPTGNAVTTCYGPHPERVTRFKKSALPVRAVTKSLHHFNRN